ncbi:hypothetical protein RFI_13430 [Reticulomyxa filosa]|uniref:Transmembrane protein n=1 Tax=Reticulomyxa filosa TaxID=46433 RepID=X6NBS5_RETFI|nr:hypothetical protein RFI_13430 [Reticulomyxa filosa]|eukprot:ETO23750.1 hypothetical protein RFI_13430 [Reticulomyxa filosa]
MTLYTNCYDYKFINQKLKETLKVMKIDKTERFIHTSNDKYQTKTINFNKLFFCEIIRLANITYIELQISHALIDLNQHDNNQSNIYNEIQIENQFKKNQKILITNCNKTKLHNICFESFVALTTFKFFLYIMNINVSLKKKKLTLLQYVHKYASLV